jgi:hypothetical protein
MTKNNAEHHFYIVIFNRDGKFQKMEELDDINLEIQKIGVLASGALLAFGYDGKDNSPKLAMLRDDGTLLKVLQIPKDDAPESIFGTKDGGKGPAVYIAPSELVPEGQSILVV